jgi:NCAIR mutase (PurE)-related protein
MGNMKLTKAFHEFIKLDMEQTASHIECSMIFAPSECHDLISNSSLKAITKKEKELGITVEEMEEEIKKRQINIYRATGKLFSILAKDNPLFK